ncbi:MAG: hypothetical protein IPM23_22685 [Candidatus Melainabacteria bacterium]|nr:hypothetical protein [Candidatus Melainabacteria bacterium]
MNKAITVHELMKSGETGLQEFEASFSYPLGEGRHFHISHGDHYGLFYGSMGESAVLVAEDRSGPVGTVAVCLRELRTPDGSYMSCAYTGDLKLSRATGSGRTLLALLGALQNWCLTRTGAAVAVVMEGTPITPERYSGRLGLAPMERLGSFAIHQLPASVCTGRLEHEVRLITAEEATGLADLLSRPEYRFAFEKGDTGRSLMAPVWLKTRSEKAVACLEDTRMAKRLFREDGSEIRNCHLTCFQFEDPGEARSIIAAARDLAFRAGFEAVFMSLDSERAGALAEILADPSLPPSSGALVYGAGSLTAARHHNWYINSSEV